MRIEILANGISSTSQVQSSLKSLNNDIEDTIASLKKVKSKLQDLPGGVQNLSTAVSSVNERIRREEERKRNVETVSTKVDLFLGNTVETDKQVEQLVDQNREKFINTYSWAKPVPENEKSWWQQRVDDWNAFWESAEQWFSKTLEGLCNWLKEHAVELIIGAVAIVVGAVILAITGGSASILISALLAGLKAAAVSALIGGAISGVIAAFTGENILKAFGDGFASGFKWGGIFFTVSSTITAIKTLNYVHSHPPTTNKIAGCNRETRVKNVLEKIYGKKNVLPERYIRDSAGKIIKDSVTGKGRRIDFIIIKGDKIIKSFEVTSKTASKVAQIAKELRIIEAGRQIGGAFIQNPNNGQLIEITEKIITNIWRLI